MRQEAVWFLIGAGKVSETHLLSIKLIPLKQPMGTATRGLCAPIYNLSHLHVVREGAQVMRKDCRIASHRRDFRGDLATRDGRVFRFSLL